MSGQQGLSVVSFALTLLSLAGSGIIVWEQSARRAAMFKALE